MKSTKPPLKIAFVYDDSLDGDEGVTRAIKTLGAWLMKRGHKVSYFVGETKIKDYGGAPVYSLSKNVGVIFNGNRLSIPLPASVRKIKAALRTEQPDVLHVQMPHSPLMAQIVVNHSDSAVVGSFHIYPANFIARSGSRLLKLLYLNGLRKFDEVVSVSPAAAQFAKSYYGLDSTIIPNSVDLKGYRNSIKNKPGRVVFLGRLVERKGCKQLIEAFAAVSELVPKSELLIAGDGPQRTELEELVHKKGLNNKIKFLGFVSEAEKIKLLASAQVACFPSLYGESFGIVLIEAMAAGAGMVLAGNNPGYTTVLGNKPELLIDPKNTEAFTGRLVELMTNKTQAAKLHSWLREEVRKYDIEKIGRQTEALYNRSIAKKTNNKHNEAKQ
jgi:phosphatidylinositol alpha-mannosyltransferase